MKHATQVAILREMFGLMEAGGTVMADAPFFNPAATYTGEERYRRELDTFFSGMPLLAGFTGDAPAPGDWFAHDLGGTPLLFMRAEDGVMRAFVNICRHRGSRLAEGRGHTPKVLACNYHAWSYTLDGQLNRRPRDLDGFAGIPRESLGLIPVPCEERHGMIFARPCGDAAVDVGDHLGAISAEMGEFGFGAYRYFKEVTHVLPANWKLFMDTFMEGYHIFALHRTTLNPVFHCYPSFLRTFGPHLNFGALRKTVGELQAQPESEWSLRANASVIYMIAPNAIFNLPMDGHLEYWEFSPRSVGETQVRMRFYTPAAIGTEREHEKWTRSFDISSAVIFEEDFLQQVRIHANLATGRLPGVYYGRNEAGLIHFHRQMYRMLGLPQPEMPA